MSTAWINSIQSNLNPITFYRGAGLFCTLAIQIMAGAALVSSLGCASHIDKVKPKNLATMDEIYDEKNGSKHSAAMRRRTAEIQARPVAEAERVSDLPPAMLHVKQLYPKLPNPEVFMYVKPHPTGQSGAVIPGYYTRFSMYERDYYALPTEQLGSIEPKMQAIEQAEQKRTEQKQRAMQQGKKQ